MSLSSPQTFNRYSYVNNDPVNLSDPSGLIPYTGADKGWGSFEGFGGGLGFNGPHFGGPEAMGEALIGYNYTWRVPGAGAASGSS